MYLINYVANEAYYSSRPFNCLSIVYKRNCHFVKSFPIFLSNARQPSVRSNLSEIFFSARHNTGSTRITRAAEEFPRARDFRRVFLFRSNLDYRRGRKWRVGSSGVRSRRYVPAYVTREFRVPRTYTNATHVRAETGLHRLASAHIGITLSLT